MGDACDIIETVPTKILRVGPCGPDSRGLCTLPVPKWMQRLRTRIAKDSGAAFMAPSMRVMRVECESTFGGRWFAEENTVGVILHPSPAITYAVAVHEMAHWLKWIKMGDEPGEHDDDFFKIVEALYKAYGVTLSTAKTVEGSYPHHWNRRVW